jgi:hypothetical protein
MDKLGKWIAIIICILASIFMDYTNHGDMAFGLILVAGVIYLGTY